MHGGPVTSPLPSGTVTFLFTDIEGSTRLLDRLGHDFAPLLATHHHLLDRAIRDAGGVVVNTMGDGFFAAFPSADAGLRAAIAGQRSLSSHPWPEDATIKVRMGLHTGDAVALDGGYVAIAVHHAARIGDVGHGGQVVISDAARALVADHDPDVTFGDLGPHRLKDLGGPIHLHQVHHPDLGRRFPPLRSLDRVPHNLPIQPTPFIGRHDEQREVGKLVGDERLVTIAGAGGSGKTRLALQVAADAAGEVPGGVWLAELAPIADPDEVVEAVADALSIHTRVAGRPTIDLVVERLATRPTILVIDNCEHVLGAVADVTGRILRSTEHTRVLATSREPLGIPGEHVWRIPSMAVGDGEPDADAVRLFLDRAVRVRPGWAPTPDELAVVQDVCVRLDGIPLAIELAAARIALLDVATLRDRLADRFRLLTGGSRVALERQRTLRATVDWSHDQLDDASRTLLRRLATFVGGFSLAAAESVCADGSLDTLDVLDALDDLARKSMVQVDATPLGSRYRLLETIRQYALEKLLEAGESDLLRQRHHDHFAELAALGRESRDWRGLDYPAWVDRLDADHDNLLAAIAWAAERDDPLDLDRLLASLARVWELRKHLHQLDHWYDVALAHPGEHRPELLARLLIEKAAVGYFTGVDHEELHALSDRAREVATRTDDAFIRVITAAMLAMLRGRSELESALALAAELDEHVFDVEMLGNLALCCLDEGDHDGAVQHFEAAVRAGLASENPRTELYRGHQRVLVAQIERDRLAMEAAAVDLLRAAEQLREVQSEAEALQLLWFCVEGRDLDQARAISERLVQMGRRTGMAHVEAHGLFTLAINAWNCGEVDRGLAHVSEAAVMAASIPALTYVATTADAVRLWLEGEHRTLIEKAEEVIAAGIGEAALHAASAQRDTAAMATVAALASAVEATRLSLPNTVAATAAAVAALWHDDHEACATSLADALGRQLAWDDVDTVLDLLVIGAELLARTDRLELAGSALGVVEATRDATGYRRAVIEPEVFVAAAEALAGDSAGFAQHRAEGRALGERGFRPTAEAVLHELQDLTRR